MRRGLDIPARAIHIDRYQTHSTFFQPSILKLKPLRILMAQPDENLSQKKKHFLQGITIVPKLDTGSRTSERARKVT